MNESGRIYPERSEGSQLYQVAMVNGLLNHEETRPLDRLGLGEKGVVVGVRSSNSQLRNKLLMMGIVDNTMLEVTNVAPLGDPITISVRGFRLSLRRSEARSILLRLK